MNGTVGDAGGDLPDRCTIPLDPPVELKGGGRCTELVLQEPRARQVKEAEQKLDSYISEASITDYEMHLVRSVSGVSDEVVKALPVVTLGRCMGFLQPFLDAGSADAQADAEADEKGMDLDALPDAVEVAVEPPLKWNGAEYPVILLRQPRAAELRSARAHTKTATTPYTVRCFQMALLTSVSGLPPAVVDGLRIRTLTEASRHLARFIRAGRQAGKALPSS